MICSYYFALCSGKYEGLPFDLFQTNIKTMINKAVLNLPSLIVVSSNINLMCRQNTPGSVPVKQNAMDIRHTHGITLTKMFNISVNEIMSCTVVRQSGH